MNEKTYFPWLESLKTRFLCSFPEVDSEAFSVLHNNVHEEYVNLLNSPKKSKLKAFYALLRDFYFHICWKINWNKEHHLYSNCVGFLFYLSHVALILSKGNVYSTWFNHILMILKSFQGDPFLVCDVLLLMKNVKKKYHKAYAEILKSVLYDVNMKEPPNVECFIKVILLFRRLKLLTVTETSCSEIVIFTSEIKPPPGVKNWLSSLGVEEFHNIKMKKIAQKLLKNEFQRKYIEKLLHVLLADKYDEKLTNFKEYKVSEIQECESKLEPKKKKHVKITAKKKKKANNHPCRLEDKNSALECETYISHQKVIVTSHDDLEESSEANHHDFPTGTKEERSTLQNIQHPLVLNSEYKLELEMPLSKTSNSQKKKSKKRSFSQTVNSTEPSPENSSTNHRKKKKRNNSDTVNSKKETDSEDFSIQTDETQNLNYCQRSMVNDKTIVTSPEHENSTSGTNQIVPQNLLTNYSSPSKDSLKNHQKKSKVFIYSNNVDNSENYISSNKSNLPPTQCTKAMADGSFKIFHPDHQGSCEIETNYLNEAFSMVPCSDDLFSSNKTCNSDGTISLCNQNQNTLSKCNQSTPLVRNKDNLTEFCPNICFGKTVSYIKSPESSSIKNLTKSYPRSDNLINETRGVSAGFDDSNICLGCEHIEAEDSALHGSKTGKKEGIKNAVGKYSSARSNSSLKDLETSTCKNSGNQNSPISLHNDCLVEDQIITNETIESDKPNIFIHDCDSEVQNSTLENSKAYINGNAPTENHGVCPKNKSPLKVATNCGENVVITQEDKSKHVYCDCKKNQNNIIGCSDACFNAENENITVHSLKIRSKQLSRFSEIRKVENVHRSTDITLSTVQNSAVECSDACNKELFKEENSTTCVISQISPKFVENASEISCTQSNAEKSVENGMKAADLFISPLKPQDMELSLSSSESLDLSVSRLSSIPMSNLELSRSIYTTSDSATHDIKIDAPENPRKKRRQVRSKKYISSSDGSSSESDVLKCKENASKNPRKKRRRVRSKKYISSSDSCESDVLKCKEVKAVNDSDGQTSLNKLLVKSRKHDDKSDISSSESNALSETEVCEKGEIVQSKEYIENSDSSSLKSNIFNSKEKSVTHESSLLLEQTAKLPNNVTTTDICKSPTANMQDQHSRQPVILKNLQVVVQDYFDSPNCVNSREEGLAQNTVPSNKNTDDNIVHSDQKLTTVGKQKGKKLKSSKISKNESIPTNYSTSKHKLNDSLSSCKSASHSKLSGESSFENTRDSDHETNPSDESSTFGERKRNEFILYSASEDNSFHSASTSLETDLNDFINDSTDEDSLDKDSNSLFKTSSPVVNSKSLVLVSESEDNSNNSVFSLSHPPKRIYTAKKKFKSYLLASETDDDDDNDLKTDQTKSEKNFISGSVSANPFHKAILEDKVAPDSKFKKAINSKQTKKEAGEVKFRTFDAKSDTDFLNEVSVCSNSNEVTSSVVNTHKNNPKNTCKSPNKKLKLDQNSPEESTEKLSKITETSNHIQNEFSGLKIKDNSKEILCSSENQTLFKYPEISNNTRSKTSISKKRVNAKEDAIGSENQSCSSDPEISNNIQNKSSRSKKRVNAEKIISPEVSNRIQNKSSISNKRVNAKEIKCSSENQSCSENPEISNIIRNKSSRSKKNVNATEISSSGVSNSIQNKPTRSNKKISAKEIPCSSENQSCSKNLEISHSIQSKSSRSKRSVNAKEIACSSENQSSIVNLDSNLRTKMYNLRNSSPSKVIMKISSNNQSGSANNSKRSTLRNRQNPSLEIPSSASVSVLSNKNSHLNESSSKEVACESPLSSNVNEKHYSLRKKHDSNKTESTPALKSDSLYDIPLSELQKRIKNTLNSSLDLADLVNINQLCLGDSSNNITECGGNLNPLDVNQHEDVISNNNLDHSVENNLKEYALENVVHNGNLLCTNLEPSKSKQESNLHRQNSVTSQTQPIRDINKSMGHSVSADKSVNKDPLLDSNCLFDEKFFLACLDKIDSNILANPEYLNSCIDDYLNSTSESAIINDVGKNPNLNNFHFNNTVSDNNVVSSSNHQIAEYVPHLANTSSVQYHDDRENSRKNPTAAVVIQTRETKSDQNSSLEKSDSDQLSTHLFFNGNNSKNSGKIGCEISLRINTNITETSNFQKDTSNNSDNVLISCSDQNSKVCAQFQVNNKPFDPTLSEIDFKTSISDKMSSTLNSESLMITEQPHESLVPVNFNQSTLNVSGLDTILNTETNSNKNTNDKQVTGEKILFICDVGEKMCEGYLMPPNSSVTITNKLANVSCVTSSLEDTCSSSTDCNCSVCRDPSSIVYDYQNDENSENVSRSNTNTPRGNACKNRMKRPTSLIPVINLGARCDQEEFAQNNLNDSTSTLYNESLLKESIFSPTSNICDVGKKRCEGYLMPPSSSVAITNKLASVSCVTSSHEDTCSSSTDCKDPSSIVNGYHNGENSENIFKSNTNSPRGNACKNRKKGTASLIPVINLGTRCDQEEFGQNNLKDSTSILSNESLMKENNNQGNSFLKSNPQKNGSENSNKKNISRIEKSICDEKDNCTVIDEEKKGYNLRTRSRLRKWTPY